MTPQLTLNDTIRYDAVRCIFFLFFSCSRFHALLYDNELPPFRNIFPGGPVRGPEEGKKKKGRILTLSSCSLLRLIWRDFEPWDLSGTQSVISDSEADNDFRK